MGKLDKSEVRKIAANLNLTIADKKDSQGICFLGKVKVADFLEKFLEDRPGDIVTTDGRVVGKHRGLHRYTLGQRKGIGVPSNADNENFVVSGKEFEANRLIVAFDGPNAPGLWGKRFAIDNLSHISEAFPKEAELLAKPRYRDPSEKVAFR